MSDVLWRLLRPVVLLAVIALAALALATLLLQLATRPEGALIAVASILAGLALLAGLLAGVELLLAALALKRYLDGGGRRCSECDWPLSPSILLPDRCTNPRHGKGAHSAD